MTSQYLKNRYNAGFSLVEIMIVIAIIGILSSIALPAYNRYVTQAATTEATSGLATRRTVAEQYFQDNRTYVGMPCNPAGSKFNFNCGAPDATTYTITATGVSDPVNGFSYSVNQANVRSSTYDGTTMACWQTAQGAC